MAFSRRPGITSLAVLLSVTGTDAAAASALPYAKLAQLQDEFLRLPADQRDKLTFATLLVREDRTNHSPIHMWVEAGSTRTDIPVTATGEVGLPMRQDWIDQNAVVHTDQPAGTLHVTFGLFLAPPPAPSVPTTYLLAGMKQAQAVLRAGYRKAAGMLALLAVPTLDRLEITFSVCCTQTVILRGQSGQVTLTQATSGIVQVPLAALNARADGSVTFSAPTARLDPTTD